MCVWLMALTGTDVSKFYQPLGVYDDDDDDTIHTPFAWEKSKSAGIGPALRLACAS